MIHLLIISLIISVWVAGTCYGCHKCGCFSGTRWALGKFVRTLSVTAQVVVLVLLGWYLTLRIGSFWMYRSSKFFA